jgi:CopG family nickel-responsive transcriptional regulator
VVVVSVTLPGDLLKKFDSFIEDRGYYSRSEAFRDALRSLMSESQLQEEKTEKVVAAIMVIYEYPRKDVTTRLIRLLCDLDDVVIENLHRHLGHNHCLSVFIAEGTVQKIRGLAGRMTGIRGIQQVRTILIPVQGYVPASANSANSGF